MIRAILFPVLTSLCLSCTHESPKKDTPSAETLKAAEVIPVFDGKKALGFLQAQTDFGPRDAGSQGHEACLHYLQHQMKEFADTVRLQAFTARGYDGTELHFTNVVSSFNPGATTRILLLAHWDSRPRADQDPDPSKRNQAILGANDGASGVAVLMEIARHLRSHPPAIGVDILFDDGEDYGKEGDTRNYLLGTRYFSKHLPPGFNPRFGILLDMVGDRQLELQKEPYSLQYAADVVDLVWSAATDLGVYQFTSAVQRAVLDDHLPLNEVGIKTIDIIDFNYPDTSNRFWHTTNDTPDKCSPESLEAVGKVLTYVIYRKSS
jgi:hypothetical protein